MKVYSLDGVPLTIGVAFESQGFKHPRNWADVWEQEDFARWGVVVKEVADPEVPEERPRIEKWVVMERLTDEQLELAISLMSVRQQEKWRMPGYPTVYKDDPELLQLLLAVGADPKVILE